MKAIMRKTTWDQKEAISNDEDIKVGRVEGLYILCNQSFY